jgi:hypothetical protein
MKAYVPICHRLEILYLKYYLLWADVLCPKGLPLCLKDEEAAKVWLNLLAKNEDL